jgi:hypothetical protein
MDSVSYQQGNYSENDTNSASIYCGRRTYKFGGDGAPQPAWLSLDLVTGTIAIQTTNDSHVNYTSGYSVTLTACLEFYPKTCSTPVTFKVIINECQIVSFGNTTSQPDLSFNIFQAAFS